MNGCCGSRILLTISQMGGAVSLAAGEAFTAINSTFFKNSVRSQSALRSGVHSLILRALFKVVLSVLTVMILSSFSATSS